MIARLLFLMSLCFHLAPVSAVEVARLLVRVDPVDLGARSQDELPAELVIDRGRSAALDPASLRVVRVDSAGRAVDDEPLPLRWYDAAIPYQFPETQDSISRSNGKLEPKLAERGGYFLNAVGDGRAGRLVWTHTQNGRAPAWYAVEFRTLPEGTSPQQLGPQGWIGDGQARCAEKATQTVQSDMLRVDLDDWNGDGLTDLITGESFGHVVWWPNLGTKTAPKFEVCRIIADADGQPIDVGIVAVPKVCDWDADGDRDLLIGTERNRMVWFENIAADPRETPKLNYRGVIILNGKPLELPVTPLTRGEPAIFKLDYFPVPEFVDWDGDGDRDLLAGGYITGCVFFYKNNGGKLIARGPLEADGAVLNVTHWCASPCAVDLDADGDLDLLSGHTPLRDPTIRAGLRYFENIGTRTVPKLASRTLDTGKLRPITAATPRAFDWDDDGDFDLVISVRTDLLLLENTGTRTQPKFDKVPTTILPKWGPAPVHATQLIDWNGDGRVDLVNALTVRLNTGAKNPWHWSPAVSMLQAGAKIEHKSGRGDEERSVFLDDFDGDGVIDVLFGDWFGHVWLHRNRGSREKPDFDLTGIKLATRDGSPIKVGPIGKDPDKDFNALQGARTVVTAGDFDGDGQRDLVVGDTFGKVRFFRQLPGSPLQFAPAIEIGDLGIRLNVCATDWNQDGRMDVIAGSANGKVRVFLSDGSSFAPGIAPKLPPIMQPRVLLGDLNGDGDDDLYFPSTQGSVFVERSFLTHGYARGVIVEATR